MDYRNAVLQLLKESGLTLVRSKRHSIYKRSDGVTWTIPQTPSDRHHAWANNYSGLKPPGGDGRRKDPLTQNRW